jgi:hypothetical protein
MTAAWLEIVRHEDEPDCGSAFTYLDTLNILAETVCPQTSRTAIPTSMTASFLDMLAQMQSAGILLGSTSE